MASLFAEARLALTASGYVRGVADEHPPDPLFHDVDQWQEEEAEDYRAADRFGLVLVAAIASMVFTALLIMFNNTP